MFNDIAVASMNIIQITSLGENSSFTLFLSLSTLRKLNSFGPKGKNEIHLIGQSEKTKLSSLNELLKSTQPFFPLGDRCLLIAQIFLNTSNP